MIAKIVFNYNLVRCKNYGNCKYKHIGIGVCERDCEYKGEIFSYSNNGYVDYRNSKCLEYFRNLKLVIKILESKEEAILNMTHISPTIKKLSLIRLKGIVKKISDKEYSIKI